MDYCGSGVVTPLTEPQDFRVVPLDAVVAAAQAHPEMKAFHDKVARLQRAVQGDDGLGHALLDGTLQLLDRVAAAEVHRQGGIEGLDGELAVVGRVVAENLGQGLVDTLVQTFKDRVPAVLDAGDIEGTQLLDAPVQRVLGAVRAGLLGVAGGFWVGYGHGVCS